MISIIIPAYNEENAISGVISDCKQALTEIGEESAEILVVDDGSSDRTAEIAESSATGVVRHPHNLGYGRSIKDGIKAARNDTIIIIDGDGTYPADIIPTLVKEYQKGLNMVVGQRKGKIKDEPIVKKLFRQVLKLLVEFTAGRSISDINSGLRVFSKKESIRYLPTLCNTFSFTTSITLAYMMTGKYVSYIPIDYGVRIGKTKVRYFKDSLRTLQYIIEAILYYNPIKIFLVISLGLGLLAISAFVLIPFTPGYYLLFTGLAFLVLAIVNFALGLVAMLIQQMLKRNFESNIHFP